MDDEFQKLRNFVIWAGLPASLRNEWSIDETLKYVADGVERFLANSRAKPWIEKKGAKGNPDLMWRCFHLTFFAEPGKQHMPHHTYDGGAFVIVGEHLGIDAEAVKANAYKARKIYETEEGKEKFARWFCKENGISAVDAYIKGTDKILEEQEKLMFKRNAQNDNDM